MRGGGPAIALVLILVLLALPLGAPGRPPVEATGPSEDLGAWFLGDRWTYGTRTITRLPDGTFTDTSLVLTTRVDAVLEVTVGGTAYTVYNASTTGTVATSGRFPMPVFGLRDFSLTGSVTGWVWSDRSDLAIVRTNQTGIASGTLDLPLPFPDAPINVDGAATVTPTPAQEEFDFPLELGDTWSYDVAAATRGYARVRVGLPGNPIDQVLPIDEAIPSALSLWLNATEDVVVPAGTFLGASRIAAVAPGGGTQERWYHPSVKNLVKMESHTVTAPDDATHVWSNLTAYTLVVPPWPGSIGLDPVRVNPGGWVNASGAALPGEAVTVRIPSIGATYGATADGSGAWSVRVRAPANDDRTPANADVGSHGVIVQSALGNGWDVATVQLLVPDLSVRPTDLVPSDPSPAGGQPVTLNGTVRAGAAVGVHSPFNVSFAVDGAEVARYPVAEVEANGSRTFATVWTAVPGWHDLAFTADPDDEVPETDEGNNTARRSVFVRGPDLVPVDIVVSSDAQVASYPDPAAVGFVAPALDGRIGATVFVAFSVRNVGSEVSPPFRVAVVETQGLRGPPMGPRVLDEALPGPLLPGGAGGPWNASWTIPSAVGIYYHNVTVDADGEVAEEWESNNTFVVVVNVSGPDYAVVQAVLPPTVTAGSTHALNATVRNTGRRDGFGDVGLEAYEGASPTPFAAATVPALAVGESLTVSFPWTAPPSAAVVTLRVVVDPADVLEEMDEGNNAATVVVDVRDPPRTSMSWQGPAVQDLDLFVTGATAFSLDVEDRSGAGAAAWFRIDGGPPTPYAAPFSLAGEGPHDIEFWAEDGLGGVEAPNVRRAVVDETAPATSLGVGAPNATATETYVTSATPIRLAATDGPQAAVGLGSTEYRIDGGAWTPYAAPFTLPAGDGPRAVEFRSTDRLGNREAARAAAFVVDDTPPSAAATFEVLPGHSVVTLQATDAGSGVHAVEYSLDGGPWTPYEGPFPVDAPGNHSVVLRAVDRLGNRAQAAGTWSVPQPPSTNLKPLLAAVLAVLLALIAFLRQRGLQGRRRRTFLALAAGVVLAEAATGVASLGYAPLAIPPAGLGAVVDGAIFLTGLLLFWLLGRPPPDPDREEDPPEEEAATPFDN